MATLRAQLEASNVAYQTLLVTNAQLMEDNARLQRKLAVTPPKQRFVSRAADGAALATMLGRTCTKVELLEWIEAGRPAR